MVDGKLLVFRGAALAEVTGAQRVDPALTEEAAARSPARDLSDAMIHLGGHILSQQMADEELSGPQEARARVCGVVGALIFFMPFALLIGISDPNTFLSLYGAFSAALGYGLGAMTGSGAKARQLVATGQVTATSERRPT
ncbi:hypothetical protein [Actinokineospora sp. NBRC 105648]|uniref:hypothetical protein n=1 Tax=Actinokineospora sp. NBRC 105648 TaxID=3032206 RepID=UPI00255694D0|nr:hypothetical protein [Actinokineospora sp. NBRC 105648]